MQTANTASEWLALLDQKHIFVVRTPEQLRDILNGDFDLSRFAATTRVVVDRLRKLPAGAREIILSNLEFNNRGLVHGDYSELSKYLSRDELFEFFAIFGISKLLATDYQNNYCESPGTCAKKIDKICTSNCHH